MLRFLFISGLGYLLACQSTPPENLTAYSSDAENRPLSTEGNLSGSLTDEVETLKQDAQRIQQLRLIVHQQLDSLYRQENTEEILGQIEAYEKLYLVLAETDEAFIDWQHQQTISYDSLETSTDNELIQKTRDKLKLWTDSLRRNIEHAEALLTP